MDGTIYLGDALFPFTLPFLSSLKRRGVGYTFLTNNPSSSKAGYLEKLARMGIEADESNLLTTAEVTIEYILDNYPSAKRLYILGTPGMISQFEAAGLCSVEEDPDLVVVSFDKTLTYERVCKAAWYIKKGLPYLATNPDRVCPTELPTVLVDCGSICAMLESATGRKPDVTFGKPDPQMLLSIARRNSLPIESVAMVGDRLYTDIASGRNAGAVSILVLSGETDAAAAAASPIKPDLVVDSIQELI